MKRLVVIFLMGFLTLEALAQDSVDIGIFGGTGTYLGDMTRTDLSKSVNPTYGGFLRYNFNPRYAVRLNVLNGKIGADGDFESKLWNFTKNVLDVSFQFEFNYLKYIVGDKETPYSTYLFVGGGVQMYDYEVDLLNLEQVADPSYFDHYDPSGPVLTPTIPFGLGFKFNLSKRFGLGIEGGLRKSFSDKLDNLDDPLSYTNKDKVRIKYTDQWHNNDWTAYVGVHLVYKMIYGYKNWELKTSRKNMLDWGIWNKTRTK